MQTALIRSKLGSISWVFLCNVSLLLAALPPPATPADVTNSDAPSELRASDSQIRQLLEEAQALFAEGNVKEAIEKEETAVATARQKAYVRDRAVAEAALASGYINEGRFEEGFLRFHEALRDATDSSNLVLEADILTALSSEEQMRSNTLDALDILVKALNRAEKSQNLYIKSRVLGEMSRLQLLDGRVENAGKSIEQALEIDRNNGYHFYAMHLVYRGNVFLEGGALDTAVDCFTEARKTASDKNDAYTFFLSTNALATAFLRKGDVTQGLASLEKVRKIQLGEDRSDPGLTLQIQSYFLSPTRKLAFLEGLGTAYRAAKQPEKALVVWNELLAVGREIASAAVQAEAAQQIGDLNRELKRNSEAVTSYAMAAALYRAIPNDHLLVQTLISEASVLMQERQGAKAIPLEEELLEISARLRLKALQANAYGVLAEIYVPAGNDGKALEVLEKAEALIRPDPMESGIAPSAIIEDYTLLADLYKKQQKPIEELVALEMATGVALKVDDKQATGNLASRIKLRFDELHVHDLATKAMATGDLIDALYLSEIIFVYEGIPSQPGADTSNWDRVLNIPPQLSARPEGVEALSQLLDRTGWLLKLGSIPPLDALSRQYMLANSHAELIELYSTKSEAILKDSAPNALGYRSSAACLLALAYARQGKSDLAFAKEPECMSTAKLANDKKTLDFANVAIVLTHLALNDLNNAGDSLQYLLTNTPNNPALHRARAAAYASENKSELADAELAMAIKEFLAIGDKASAAHTYTEVGQALNAKVSEQSKAQQFRYFEAAGALYQEMGDRAGQISTLIIIGERYSAIANTKKALDQFREAYQLSTTGNFNELMGLALLDMGGTFQGTSDLKSAADAYLKAVDAYHQTKLQSMESLAMLRLAQTYLGDHRTDLALPTAFKAKSLAAGGSVVFNNYYASFLLGQIYSQMGEFENALTAYREAQSITKDAQDWGHLGYSDLAVGETNQLLGYWEEARDEAEKARGVFQKIKDRQGESLAVAMLVTVYSDRTSGVKDYEKALSYYSEARGLGLGERIELDLVESYLATGRYTDAISATKKGIKDCIKDKDIACEAHGLISLSEAERRNGNLKSAASTLKMSEPLVNKTNDFYLHGRFLYGGASQLRAEKHFQEALAAYLQVISLVENLKGQGDPKTQQNLSEAYGFIYDELTSTLHSLSAGSPDPQKSTFASVALQYAETNKARQFANSWGRTFITEIKRTLPPSVREAEDSLARRGERLEPVSQGPTEHTSDFKALENEKLKFVSMLRASYPQYAAVAYPEPIKIETLPLRANETLVEFKVAEDSTFVWIVRNEKDRGNRLLAFYEVPRPRRWFDEKTSALRKALNTAQVEGTDWKIAEDLFDALFPANVMIDLVRSGSIVFIPDDVLSVLPFEILSPQATKGTFPFLNIPTRYYPSAAALKLSRTAILNKTWEKAFLGVADPITSPNDERYDLAKELSAGSREKSHLNKQPASNVDIASAEKITARGFSLDRIPGTSTEVRNIAGLFQSANQTAEIRLGPDATKEMLLNTDLSRFRFLHFATHGILPVDTGIKEPSLVLSYDGASVSDMYLSMSEILGLKVEADAVVLSACNTGSGTVSHAEGVMSLGRAFLASGASSVAVSLWQVSDQSTSIFMEEFYRNLLLGKQKDVALAAARVKLFDKGYKQPFYWAPFILIGE